VLTILMAFPALPPMSPSQQGQWFEYMSVILALPAAFHPIRIRTMKAKQPPVALTCASCGTGFVRKASEARNGGPSYCSRACFHASMRGKIRTDFETPESTRKDRIRAQGLVNSRVKRGLLARKCQCEECGDVGRMDAHHEDYTKPDMVEWLCRKCHTKRHWQKKSA
jgi:hypothetical protein